MICKVIDCELQDGSFMYQVRCLPYKHLLCIIKFVSQDTIPKLIPSLKQTSSPLKNGGLLGDDPASFWCNFGLCLELLLLVSGTVFVLSCFELIVYFCILEGPGQLNPTIFFYVITCFVCTFRCSYLLSGFCTFQCSMFSTCVSVIV